MRAWIVILGLATGVSACLPGGFFTQKKSAKSGATTSAIETTESNGVVTGRLDPNAALTQTMGASESSEIAGSSVSFPPGAIAIATDISLEQGADVLTDGTLTALGVGGDAVSTAGPAVLLESSVAQDATQPFTIAITVNSAQLALLQAGELAVLYKVIRNDQGGGLFVGFISPSEVKLDGNKLVFATKYFGAYQAVRVTTDVSAIAAKPTTEPLVGRSDVGTLAAGQVGAVFKNLSAGTKYYWKVEALDAGGKVVGQSDVWEFTTK
jgi:hypothetical protein